MCADAWWVSASGKDKPSVGRTWTDSIGISKQRKKEDNPYQCIDRGSACPGIDPKIPGEKSWCFFQGDGSKRSDKLGCLYQKYSSAVCV